MLLTIENEDILDDKKACVLAEDDEFGKSKDLVWEKVRGGSTWGYILDDSGESGLVGCD
jgi:hypothetical protein